VDIAIIWRCAQIILINVVLSGDNAVVIAMAARTLPKAQRTKAIAFGASLAIAIRVAVTIVVMALLRIPFLSALGGALVLWIAAKLLVEEEQAEGRAHQVKGFWHAMWIIAVADFVMSTDNMIAVAGAAGGSWRLILFGLALSIPIIMFCSAIIASLMDRYPILQDIGAGILGWTGGEMIVADAWIKPWLGPHGVWVRWALPAVCTAGVIAVGHVLMRPRAGSAPAKEERASEAGLCPAASSTGPQGGAVTGSKR
jgi:YjbE family integral membrane protein